MCSHRSDRFRHSEHCSFGCEIVVAVGKRGRTENINHLLADVGIDRFDERQNFLLLALLERFVLGIMCLAVSLPGQEFGVIHRHNRFDSTCELLSAFAARRKQQHTLFGQIMRHGVVGQ